MGLTEVEDLYFFELRVVPQEVGFPDVDEWLFDQLVAPVVHLFQHLRRYNSTVLLDLFIDGAVLLFGVGDWLLALVNPYDHVVLDAIGVGDDRPTTDPLLRGKVVGDLSGLEVKASSFATVHVLHE